MPPNRRVKPSCGPQTNQGLPLSPIEPPLSPAHHEDGAAQECECPHHAARLELRRLGERKGHGSRRDRNGDELRRCEHKLRRCGHELRGAGTGFGGAGTGFGGAGTIDFFGSVTFGAMTFGSRTFGATTTGLNLGIACSHERPGPLPSSDSRQAPTASPRAAPASRQAITSDKNSVCLIASRS